MDRQFAWSERLGIHLPSLETDWDSLGRERQTAVLEFWENVRGTIPDRVKRFEEEIKVKQDRLSAEEDFGASCRLNGEIAELASRINDLHIWFRTQQDLDEDTKRHG
ncbi:hypothetical protein GE107_03190 [Cohnella sp. CFH 77786]|nr:hypothetical protein [Cohnella sp. CFH 77786]